MRFTTCLVLLCCLLTAIGCSRQKSTAQLLDDLKGAQQREQLIAVRLLSTRTHEPAPIVPALIEALRHEQADIRWSAAIGLGNFGEQAKEAVPALQTARHDRDARVREAAGVALSRIDPRLAPSSKAGISAGS